MPGPRCGWTAQAGAASIRRPSWRPRAWRANRSNCCPAPRAAVDACCAPWLVDRHRGPGLGRAQRLVAARRGRLQLRSPDGSLRRSGPRCQHLAHACRRAERVAWALVVVWQTRHRARPPPPDPLSRAWRRLGSRLARLGLRRRTTEGPLDFAERVAAARPALAHDIRRLARDYARLRFRAGCGRGRDRCVRTCRAGLADPTPVSRHALALLIAAALLLTPLWLALGRWAHALRRQRRGPRRLPPRDRALLRARCPLYARLPPAARVAAAIPPASCCANCASSAAPASRRRRRCAC